MQLEPLLGRKPQDQQKQSGALKGLQPLSLFKKRDPPCEPLDCFRTLENSCHWDGTSNPFCKFTFLPWEPFLEIFEEDLQQHLHSHPKKRVLRSAETPWNPKALPTQSRAELFVKVRVKESPVSFMGHRRVKLIFQLPRKVMIKYNPKGHRIFSWWVLQMQEAVSGNHLAAGGTWACGPLSAPRLDSPRSHPSSGKLGCTAGKNKTKQARKTMRLMITSSPWRKQKSGETRASRVML